MRQQVLAVLRKELLDHSRDRRSLASALLFPIFGPVLFAVMFSVLASWNRQEVEVDLPVVGRERAPSLIAFLERYGVRVKPPPADAESLVQAGTVDAVLIIPEDYARAFREGRAAPLQLMMDNSRSKGRNTVRRVRRLLEAYGGWVASARLLARGVSPSLASPVKIEDVDLATPEKLAASVLNMIPIFVVFAAFLGGMHVAIDVTAGERERGSLEPLLINPASRASLVLGKWLATVALAALAVLVCLAGFWAVVQRVPLQDLGVKTRVDLRAVAAILGAVLPLTLFASSLQMLVATYARSFKEAQTYLQLFLLIPIIPGFMMALAPIQSRPWMYAVPVLGQDLLVVEVMRGEGLSAGPSALALLGCLAAAAACLAVTTRLLSRERIIFGR